MSGWQRFNDQFRETTWERNQRIREARLKSKCAICGQNPRIGYPHKEDCPNRSPHPLIVRESKDE